MYDIDDLIGAKCQVALYNLEFHDDEQQETEDDPIWFDAMIVGHMVFIEDKWPYTASVRFEVVLDDPTPLTDDERHDLGMDGVAVEDVCQIDIDYIDKKRAEKHGKYKPPVRS